MTPTRKIEDSFLFVLVFALFQAQPFLDGKDILGVFKKT